ncbi:hypothetical protein [Staphylococcus felis]|uniref:Uncharacterized protein n=1 Tax=Staphylococcus felis TaxID=46127 RepID=A0ABS0QMU3_9STAP|nr:hypothetical protein [Staphylococcus felis]MBH9580540.1 hypothetical protein [Staphylococcus felis]
MVEVKDLQALKEANTENNEIIVTENIALEGEFVLQPGVTLKGQDATIEISGEGQLVGLSTNNTIENITLRTNKDNDAVYFDGTGAQGKYVLNNVTTYGAVTLIADDAKGDIQVDVENVDVVEANVTHKEEGPQGFGVTVIQGGITIWNRTPDIRFDAEVREVSVGREGEPVNGSGVFVSGTDDAKIYSKLITTNNVYTNGLLTQGVANRISGGVFTVTNAYVDRVENKGLTKTYGFNDMVLDNWGYVKEWVVRDEVQSEGTSGIGFVNFGDIDALDIQAPIRTKGTGARGINNYDGTIKKLDLDLIETHGDGAVGIQISKPVGRITVHKDIKTYGGTGESLVKGVIKQLSAIGISILDGAEVESLEVKGNVHTHGKDITPVQNEGTVRDGLKILGETLNKYE